MPFLTHLAARSSPLSEAVQKGLEGAFRGLQSGTVPFHLPKVFLR